MADGQRGSACSGCHLTNVEEIFWLTSYRDTVITQCQHVYVCMLEREKKGQKKSQCPSLVYTSVSLCSSSSSSHPLLFFMPVLFEIPPSCAVVTRNSELRKLLHVWISNLNKEYYQTRMLQQAAESPTAFSDLISDCCIVTHVQ